LVEFERRVPDSISLDAYAEAQAIGKAFLPTADVSSIPRRGIQLTMLLNLHTRTFLAEAAKAVQAMPCPNDAVIDGRWLGYESALAKGRMH
jgi:hypothetical protein